jgi:hypothetical protein
LCDAEWFTAVATAVLASGTIVLAAVAIFPDTVRGWFYKPTLEVSIKTQPPDCLAMPFTRQVGTLIGNGYYLRLRVKNSGNTIGRNVEVYASQLLRRRADNITWDIVTDFPTMNLKWANIHTIYFPMIVPDMGRHCDLGHIVDPAIRNHPDLREENPRLQLTNQQPSLAFDVIARPNNKGHIIGPGDYQLKILIGAENSRRPIEKTVSISLKHWYADEATMLRDGVGVSVA